MLLNAALCKAQSNNRDVAQLGSAPPWGGGGRRFKSCRSDHLRKNTFLIKGVFLFQKPLGFEPLKCASVLLNRQGLKCPVLSDQLEKSFYQKGVFLFQKPLGF